MLIATASKAGLIDLLQQFGHTVTPVRRAKFSAAGGDCCLRWRDPGGVQHSAMALVASLTPALRVDRQLYYPSLEDVLSCGLVVQTADESEKEAPGTCGNRCQWHEGQASRRGGADGIGELAGLGGWYDERFPHV